MLIRIQLLLWAYGPYAIVPVESCTWTPALALGGLSMIYILGITLGLSLSFAFMGFVGTLLCGPDSKNMDMFYHRIFMALAVAMLACIAIGVTT